MFVVGGQRVSGEVYEDCEDCEVAEVVGGDGVGVGVRGSASAAAKWHRLTKSETNYRHWKHYAS